MRKRGGVVLAECNIISVLSLCKSINKIDGIVE